MYPDFQASGATNPSLRAIKDAPPTHDTLIIHHISDPHYGRIGGEVHPLERYKSYASRLPEEQRPNLLIVTGDLTLTGNREELREAAIHIRGAIRDDIRQRVLVVPGPHDIDWSAPNPTDSFAPLRESLGSVILPGFLDRNGNIMAGPEPYFYSTADNYLVYLVNTVMPPEAAPRIFAKPPEDLYKQYRALWKAHIKPNALYTDGERQQFLQQAKALIDRDSGVVTRPDTDRFARAVQALHLDDPAAQSQPGEELPTPLKILVTHHPLIAYTGRNAHPYGAAYGSGALIETARQHGFQLALHGHTHEPHVLADYPMEHFIVIQNPLFQIGAGSLGAVRGVNSYNSLTALRDRATGAWSLDLRVIKLDDEADYPALHFLLSNPIKEGPSVAAPAVVPSAAFDPEFNYRMQVAMEQFSEDITAQVSDLPQRPMRIIEDAIKEVVFKGYEVRVSLALKQRFATVGDPRLQSGGTVLENHYINPGHQIDPFYMHPFSYPDTLAAWSLVQGEPVTFPKDTRDGGKNVDYSWLNLSGKFPKILAQLKRMSEVQNSNDAPRAYDLYVKLANQQLQMADLFKPVPDNSLPAGFSPRFTSFICVPVPFKPRDRRPQEIREIGVLNIDVVDQPMQPVGAAFTPERVAMLQTISDFITLVLLTAHTLKKPEGVFAKADD